MGLPTHASSFPANTNRFVLQEALKRIHFLDRGRGRPRYNLPGGQRYSPIWPVPSLSLFLAVVHRHGRSRRVEAHRLARLMIKMRATRRVCISQRQVPCSAVYDSVGVVNTLFRGVF